MKGKIKKITMAESIYGGWYYKIFIDTKEGQFKTYVGTENNNYSNWVTVIQKYNQGCLVEVSNLRIKSGSIIDADSGVITHVISKPQLAFDM